MNEPAKLFITYSHRDKDAKDKLSEHLAVMARNGEIETWHDNEILPGDQWKEKISDRLAGSDILLYLTSAASLASENCNKELVEALQSGERIQPIPIILEACDWKQHKLSQFEVLPHKGKPVNKWEPEGKGWQSVVEGIRKVAQETRRPIQEEHSEPLADALLENGNFFMMLGQLASAIDAYSQAIKIKPDFVEAYRNRGAAHGMKDEHDQAIEDFTRAIELQPDFAKAYCNRGIVYSRTGEQGQAVRDLTRAIELRPDFARAYNSRGVAYGRKGKFDEAIRNFDQAIALQPDYAEAYYNRSITYERRGNLDQAIEDYNKAADTYIKRGNAHGRKGDYGRAIRDYNHSIALNSDDAAAYCNRGMFWLLKQTWDKAKLDLRTARDKGADIAELFSNDYGSVSAFEEKYHQLPENIKNMLTA